MRRLGLAAFLPAFFAGFFPALPAHAQQTFEPAVPRGLSDTAVTPSGDLGQSQTQTQSFTQTQPAAPQLVMMSPRHARDADARQCLHFANNRQIHRCAERYRPHVAHATLTKTTAKSASTAAGGGVERGFKQDLSKAAEPAKPVDTAKAAAPSSTAPAAPAKSAQAPASSSTASASASAKPADTKAAATDKPEKGSKWTDWAKGVVKSQGDHLQEK